MTATGTSSPFSKAISGLAANTRYYYKAYVIEGGEEVLGDEESFKTKYVATSTVYTYAAGSVTQTTAVLNGGYSGATGAVDYTGFMWGTSAGSLVNDAPGSSTSTSFNATITSLSENTTYYFKTYVAEYNEATSSYEYRYGSVMSFTTPAALVPQQPSGWLELPGYTTSAMSGTTSSSLGDLYYVKHSASMGGKTQRNYTCLYDPEMYASYWVAYPLCYNHKNGSGRSNQWAYDPLVPTAKQTNAVDGAYGTDFPTANYDHNLYSRGHQIANADRNGVDDMCDQTYYMTNITPQLQNGFNGGIWNNLETAVQNLTSSCDTVYVVTGAAFRKKGGSESISTITNPRDSKVLPIPNYYWKALLKVTWSGDNVVAASAIGFWYPHTDLKGESYSDSKYVVSVDQIETWTGFDLFSNLPSSLQTSAETNTSWSTFQSF